MEAGEMARRRYNKWTLTSVVAFGLAALAFSIAGCEPGTPIGMEAGSATLPQGTPVSTRAAVEGNQLLPVRTNQTILIASFNIQVFGESKMKDPWVMERIVHILRQFDIVAIQEVRATNQSLIPRLIEMVNAQGAKYDYVLGPRLGRTDSKEQYAYVYDSNSVVTHQDACYTIKDEQDLLHREPFVARHGHRFDQHTRIRICVRSGRRCFAYGRFERQSKAVWQVSSSARHLLDGRYRTNQYHPQKRLRQYYF
jgi:hypothetical protein